MEQHLNKLGTMVEELDAIEVAIPKEIKMMALLISLTKSYQTLFNFWNHPKLKIVPCKM